MGLLNKCVNATVVDEALKLVSEQDIFTKTDYPRSGLSYIAFCTERAAVNNVSVRQAIAMCMNKDGFVNDTVGDYGLRADGYYGVGQWMYTMVNAADSSEYPIEKPENGKITQQEYDKLVAEWEALNLDDVQVYDFDVDAAVALLEADGWTLNRDGKAYESGKDDVRCKTVDGVVTPLSLKMLVPAESNIDEAMEKNFAANLAQAGIQLTVEAQPMAEMLKSFYRRIDRDCDMIYLASNFGVVFDPTANFRPDSEDGVNMSNFTALDDSLLYNLAVAMRQTEPGDLLGYCKKWINFQIRLQEIEPIIPLYSGVYYDFYPQVLQNYNINSNATWSEAVIEAYMGDVMD